MEPKKVIFKNSDGKTRIAHYVKKNGKIHNSYISFYENGSKDWEGQYFNGRSVGVWKGYTGELLRYIDTYKPQQKHGIVIDFEYEK